MPLDNCEKTLHKGWKVGFLALLGLVLIVTPHCKNTTDPDTLADIVAQNLCGAGVDVFLDGAFQFTVEHASDETISGVSFGTYQLEAKKKGTEILVFSGPIECTQSLKYIWVIEGPSKIVVGNAYGEAIDIYMNGVYAGEVPKDATREIPNIGFGTHELAAARTRDGVQIEKVTIEIEDVAIYQWLIENN